MLVERTACLTTKLCSMCAHEIPTGRTQPQREVIMMVHCRELWDGPRAGTEDAIDFTGVDEVCQIAFALSS